jgi:signal transduction histidine kinase
METLLYIGSSFKGEVRTQGRQVISESPFSVASVGAAALSSEELLLDAPRFASPYVHDLPGKFAGFLATAWLRYTLAIALTAISLSGRWLLVPFLGDHVPFALVYGAVVLSALYLGLGPSVAASVMGIACVRLFFNPHGFFAITSVTELSETLTYIGGCTLIIAATEATRRSRNRLKAANHELALQTEALRSFNQHLEQRVRERTGDLKRAEESARKLGAQVLKMQDEERRRIARDLHDSVGQAVAILSMNLGALGRSENLSQRETGIVCDSKEIAQGVSDEVRTISYLLHPPLLDDMGLPAALKWYVNGFSKRTGIASHLELSRNFGRLPEDCEIAIFRIIQEALTNVHRHSESICATVRLTLSPANVRVEIVDRGKGIPADRQREFLAGAEMGVGLRGMRERVAQLGGRLDLQSSPAGTTVSATFPLNAGAEEADSRHASVSA